MFSMLRMLRMVGAGSLLCLLPQVCFAHFLWLSAGSQSADGKVHLYFSESPEPDDPALLDRLGEVSAWQWTEGKFSPIPLKKGEDSLTTETASGAKEGVFGLRHTYG